MYEKKGKRMEEMKENGIGAIMCQSPVMCQATGLSQCPYNHVHPCVYPRGREKRVRSREDICCTPLKKAYISSYSLRLTQKFTRHPKVYTSPKSLYLIPKFISYPKVYISS